LVPTRELAVQVSQALHRYGRDLGARVLPVYGGQPIGRQLRALEAGVDIVVATPGRALDHIARGTLRLGRLETVILDEADEMVDMGFAEEALRLRPFVAAGWAHQVLVAGGAGAVDAEVEPGVGEAEVSIEAIGRRTRVPASLAIVGPKTYRAGATPSPVAAARTSSQRLLIHAGKSFTSTNDPIVRPGDARRRVWPALVWHGATPGHESGQAGVAVAAPVLPVDTRRPDAAISGRPAMSTS
jgi:hypothetical protein